MIARSNSYIARPGNCSASGTIQGVLPARTSPEKPFLQANGDAEQAPDGGELRAVAARPNGTDPLPRGGRDLMGQGITGGGVALVGVGGIGTARSARARWESAARGWRARSRPGPVPHTWCAAAFPALLAALLDKAMGKSAHCGGLLGVALGGWRRVALDRGTHGPGAPPARRSGRPRR